MKDETSADPAAHEPDLNRLAAHFDGRLSARELAGDLASFEIDLGSLLATQQRDLPAVQGKGEGA